MRVLDELADALYSARDRTRSRVVSSVGLNDQFESVVTADRWAVVERRLGCPLPLPNEFETVWDLADHVQRCHSDWDPPTERTTVAWREAQVFARVRAILMEYGSLDSHEVVRSARIFDLVDPPVSAWTSRIAIGGLRPFC